MNLSASRSVRDTYSTYHILLCLSIPVQYVDWLAEGFRATRDARGITPHTEHVHWDDSTPGAERNVMAENDRLALQRLVDALFKNAKRVSRLDVILRGEAMDLPADSLGLLELLPPGIYTQQALCDQLNSALKGHGWTSRYATVE